MTARYRPTSAQRGLIEQLLRKLELLTRGVTLMHRPIFEAAGLWTPTDLDKRLDGVLDTLTAGQARDLIKALQARLGEDQGE